MMEKRFDWKRPELIAIVAALVSGIVVHLFGLVNVLQNYDNVIVQPYGYGISLHSGRWSLLLLGQAMHVFFGTYNLPWLNGVLFIFFIALTVGVIVCVFDIKCPISAAIIGITFVAFPSATATLLFKYTAFYDAIGLFFAVLAVWFLEKCKFGFIPAVFSIAFSLGVYQAYAPMTISIFVLLLIKQILADDVKPSRLVLRGLYDCASLILGLVVYFILLKFFLARFDAELLPYQGINEMGNISISQIPSLVLNAFRNGCSFPVTGYASIAQTDLLKTAYCLLWGIIIFTIVYIAAVKKKTPVQILLLILLCLTFPIAVNFIVIMCPNSSIYTLMVYPFALIPCIPLIFKEILPIVTGLLGKFQRLLTGFSLCIVLLISISNVFAANINYTSAYYATSQAQNYINSIVTQVRLTEGFTPEKVWAPLGEINDPLFYGTWDNVTIYGGNVHSRQLVSTYTLESWIQLYFGYVPNWATNEEMALLQGNETVQNMPVWPSAGSVKVIDDYVVIKFQ